MSDPTPAASRRATVRIGLVVAAILVAVAVVILRAAGPGDSPQSWTRISPTPLLGHEQPAWPGSVRTEGRQ